MNTIIPQNLTIPMVREKEGNIERTMDIFSRLLKIG